MTIKQQFVSFKVKSGRTKAFEREPTDFCKCTPGNQDGSPEQCLGVKREWRHSELPLNHLPQINQERVLQTLHDLEFLEDICHFVALHTLLFVHVLHRVHLLCVILLHNAHLRVQTRGRKWSGRWRSMAVGDRTGRTQQHGPEASPLANSLMLTLPLSSDFRGENCLFFPCTRSVHESLLSQTSCLFSTLWVLFRQHVGENSCFLVRNLPTANDTRLFCSEWRIWGRLNRRAEQHGAKNLSLHHNW